MLSPSSRRAWIEIFCIRPSTLGTQVALLAEGVDRNLSGVETTGVSCVALLAEGVDRNCKMLALVVQPVRSPSSRRAWIEISIFRLQQSPSGVALLAEGVDRNQRCNNIHNRAEEVALLAEGVDRNSWGISRTAAALASPSSRRAWIEIGQAVQHRQTAASPSSRRAWIEIFSGVPASGRVVVALLAEGVDRNYHSERRPSQHKPSPSSRRAWIEIVAFL